jgi:hypothetical protein
MASKALTKDLRIRVSKPMLQVIEALAKAHGVKPARLIRTAVWMFLNAETFEKDQNGDVITVVNKQGKKVPKMVSLGRQAGVFNPNDEKLPAMLRVVDDFDRGGVGYDTTEAGRLQEEADSQDDGLGPE